MNKDIETIIKKARPIRKININKSNELATVKLDIQKLFTDF